MKPSDGSQIVCSNGTIPVTIWGSATFDVESIDPNSITHGGAKVNIPGKSGKFQCSIVDSGSPAPGAFDAIGPPDGYPDLTCHFVTAPNMFQPGASMATVSMTLCSNGFDAGCTGKASTAITATDAIRIVRENCK
jgi:hypothetical protein